jgi:hypothetical protein
LQGCTISKLHTSSMITNQRAGKTTGNMHACVHSTCLTMKIITPASHTACCCECTRVSMSSSYCSHACQRICYWWRVSIHGCTISKLHTSNMITFQLFEIANNMCSTCLAIVVPTPASNAATGQEYTRVITSGSDAPSNGNWTR